MFLVGCASGQLNVNTLELADSSANLMVSQILANLARFRSSEYAIPSQVSIPSGSATTTNSVTPNIGVPISAAATTTLANSAMAPLFLSSTRTHLLSGGTFGVNAADQWSQNWSLVPLEDPDQLRRLRALYRYGAGVVADKAHFACEYPLVQQTPSAPSNSMQAGGSTKPSPTKRYAYSTRILNVCSPPPIGTPDPAFLRPPGCLICDEKSSDESTVKTKFSGQLSMGSDVVKNTSRKMSLSFVGSEVSGYCVPPSTTIQTLNNEREIVLSSRVTCTGAQSLSVSIAPSSSLHVLDVNNALSNTWLWNPITERPAEAVSLGRYGIQDLYLMPGTYSQRAFGDFILFVLEATLQSTSAAGGNVSGKGTPQKGGPSPLLQERASPTIQLQ